MLAQDTILLTQAILDSGALQSALEDADCGGLAAFIGRVRREHLGREVLRLEYEAHEGMAMKELKRLAAEARATWTLGPMALAHRLGRLDIGEVAVVVAVTGAHRDEVFSACRFLIEGIKASVPVWKHEFYADKSEAWVGAPGWNIKLRVESNNIS